MIGLLLSSVSASAVLAVIAENTGTVIVKAVGRFTLLKGSIDETRVTAVGRYTLLKGSLNETRVTAIARYVLLRAP